MMPATYAGPSPEVLSFLSLLPPGSIVAQLHDGSVVVCRDLEEADRQIEESEAAAGRRRHVQRVRQREMNSPN